jgi:hypothetical protein
MSASLDRQVRPDPARPSKPNDDDPGGRGIRHNGHENAAAETTPTDAANELLAQSARTLIDTASSDPWIPSSGDAGVTPPDDLSPLDRLPPNPMPVSAGPLSLKRIGSILAVLNIRYLTDGESSLTALWERHALLFAIEGPDDEILVVRARPHATVPPEFSDLAYRAVNEWNHARRFMKAYVGDPTERGQLPIFAELQIPFRAGILDTQLYEILDMTNNAVATFVDWLHGDGGLPL